MLPIFLEHVEQLRIDVLLLRVEVELTVGLDGLAIIGICTRVAYISLSIKVA